MFGDARTHTSKAGAIDTAGIVARQLAPMLGLDVVEAVSVEAK